MEFQYVGGASKDEKIRAWAIEQSIDSLSRDPRPMNTATVILRAEKIEDFVKNGKKTDDEEESHG